MNLSEKTCTLYEDVENKALIGRFRHAYPLHVPRDLKKELARLKKESKGTKKVPPSQLPRPAGGKRR